MAIMVEPVDRMSAFDAVMWGIEADPVLRSVIMSVALLGAEPDLELLRDRITRMTVAAPRLRQRLVGNPLARRTAHWEDDPHFDLGYHVRRYHVAPDGTLQPVLAVAEQLLETDFDWDRPLWEAAIVTGFAEPRAALIMKLHHAVAEGLGGTIAAEALFDRSAHPDRQPPVPAPVARSGLARPVAVVAELATRVSDGWATAGRLAADLRGAVSDAAGAAVHTVRHPADTARASTHYLNSVAKLLAPVSEPLSPLLQGRSERSALDVLTMPLAPLDAVADLAGVTRDEVLLTAVAGGVRSYHEAHRTDATQIRVALPMRVEGEHAHRNRWVVARFPLPIGERDAHARLGEVTPVVAAARAEPALTLADTIYRLLAVLPQRITTSITVGMMKAADLAVTDVPGPAHVLYAGGAEVQALMFFEPRAGAAANVSLVDYEGCAYVGINADARALPKLRTFSEHLARGFDEVLAIVDPSAHCLVGVTTGELPGGVPAAPH